MDDELKVIIGLIVSVFAGIIIAGVTLHVVLGQIHCAARWEKSGMEYSWGFFKGCTIRRPDGTWIPESAYREMNS